MGEVAGGGVFGLQRAFHTAGARDVVASLWRVDDRATAALMKLFYHHLWAESKPPLTALREAQLALYRHPDQIGKLATNRGPDFTRVVKLVADDRPVKPGRADTKLWAGFVLSGMGLEP
ncbi:MAG: CHAT domain-containing protein [Singulisphaera sp.]